MKKAPAAARRDLFVLVADSHAKATFSGLLLHRREALGIGALSLDSEQDILVHIERDGGCRARGEAFLQPLCTQYKHALLIFDHEGSGAEKTSPEQLENQLEERLSNSGWGDRAAAIVLVPELETLVWSDSPEVDHVLGWNGREIPLRNWLIEQHFISQKSEKPTRPKEALAAAIRQVRTPLSAALFSQLEMRVSLRRCHDRAFLKFKSRLKQWFPV